MLEAEPEHVAVLLVVVVIRKSGVPVEEVQLVFLVDFVFTTGCVAPTVDAAFLGFQQIIHFSGCVWLERRPTDVIIHRYPASQIILRVLVIFGLPVGALKTFPQADLKTVDIPAGGGIRIIPLTDFPLPEVFFGTVILLVDEIVCGSEFEMVGELETQIERAGTSLQFGKMLLRAKLFLEGQLCALGHFPRQFCADQSSKIVPFGLRLEREDHNGTEKEKR